MELEFLTVEEVARILKVNKMTIYRYIKAGKIVAYRVGKDLRISKKELESFLRRSLSQ